MNFIKKVVHFLHKEFKKVKMDLGGIATMGGGGPMISGQWINQRTGEQVTVRDSYMDGENMFVVLTNGQTLNMDEFQDYIQMSDDAYDEHGNKLTSQSHQNTVIKKPTYDPSVVFDGLNNTQQQSDLQNQIMTAEAESLGTTYHVENPAKTVETIQMTVSNQNNEQEQMIMKILDKTDAPMISFNVSWESYPINELKMLKDYFDVSDDAIAKAIIKKYVNKEDIDRIVTDWVNKIHNT